MAIINLLPSAKERVKKSHKQEESSPYGSGKLLKLFLFIFIFTAVSLACSWAALSLQVKNKQTSLAELDKKIVDLRASFKKLDVLKKEKKELSGKLSFYEQKIGSNAGWSKKLDLINNNIPPQIWLTSVYTEVKPNRLVIKGSSMSLVEAEIIDSISQFADRLKKETEFSSDFSQIKLGPLLSQKKTGLDVMDFSIFCEFKEPKEVDNGKS